MESRPHFVRRRICDAGDMARNVSVSLFWRVCLLNGAVFVLGTLVLVLSPATISAQPLWSEVVAVSIGLVVIVVLNGLLLRSVLRPLDRLTGLMASIDLRSPGLRLDEEGSSPARPLVQGFNAMLERLEAERRRTSAASGLTLSERASATAVPTSAAASCASAAAPSPFAAAGGLTAPNLRSGAPARSPGSSSRSAVVGIETLSVAFRATLPSTAGTVLQSREISAAGVLDATVRAPIWPPVAGTSGSDYSSTGAGTSKPRSRIPASIRAITVSTTRTRA